MSTDKYTPSPSVQRALNKALGDCTSMLPQLEWLENIAKTCPEFDPRCTALRVKWEHLTRLCRAGLGDNSVSVQPTQDGMA